MTFFRRLIRTFLLVFSSRLEKRWLWAVKNPKSAQEKVRTQIAKRAIASQYGRSFSLKKPDDFRKILPLTDFDSLAPWIDRLAQGESRVLYPGKTLLFEKTSGSSGKKKLIPYPPLLLRSFTRLFLLWVRNLLQRDPELGKGRLYISISPRLGLFESTVGGHSIGMQSDADYLSPSVKRLLAPFLVNTDTAKTAKDGATFKRETARALLSTDDLEVISIWNPTFLQVILEFIQNHRSEFLSDLNFVLSDRTREALREPTLAWTRIWPKLRLISCWMDGHADKSALYLAEAFPGVALQGKGLLATEGPVTLPWEGVQGGIPLLTEIYFEFIAKDGSILELHELVPGETYSVVISTPGGLYRYQLGDEVEVFSFFHATPTLKFKGRGTSVSDLTGEKLSERYLRQHLAPHLPTTTPFQTFIPVRGKPDCYLLLQESKFALSRAEAARLEDLLCEAHHYRHARELGQLGPLLVRNHPQASRLFMEFQARQGLQLGDIKPSLLCVRPADAPLLKELNGLNEGALS